MIVHISNLTGAAIVGRIEGSDSELIGNVWVPPGYVRLDLNHFLFLDRVGDWSFVAHSTSKELYILIVRLPDGTLRSVTSLDKA